MKTKLITVALLASAALIAPAQAGGGNHGNGGAGGGHFAGASGARSGGGPSFRGMPGGGFGGNRMIYSGQRLSSPALRSPRSMEFRPQYGNSNANTFRAPQNVNRGNRFSNGTRAITNMQRSGTGVGQVRNGNNLPTTWRNHVFAQHSGNWHRDWNRNADHWWHGHRCHFINGSWVIFDAGFYPWWGWPYWDPYYYDGYGYGYGNYGYQYGYDPNYYGEQYDDQNGYADQSGNSTIAAVQERLAHEGYYRGQIDGVFGAETRAALAQFQSNRGLRVTGALTTDTLQALGLRQLASY